MHCEPVYRKYDQQVILMNSIFSTNYSFFTQIKSFTGHENVFILARFGNWYKFI